MLVEKRNELLGYEQPFPRQEPCRRVELHYRGTAVGLSAAPGADGIRKTLQLSKAAVGRRVQVVASSS